MEVRCVAHIFVEDKPQSEALEGAYAAGAAGCLTLTYRVTVPRYSQSHSLWTIAAPFRESRLHTSRHHLLRTWRRRKTNSFLERRKSYLANSHLHHSFRK